MAETTAKKDSLITKLDKVLTPIGQKLGNEKHLQAISMVCFSDCHFW